ncbi:hypothetical protein PISL3812_01017 [Talaromyces islandicus]|uniref:Cysteine-rich transmembrane CYSTM domain-containing protein n=1 Tax=Talaromyces islandicus TaxID=28573 RepID=A0A0U1LLJ6_TALIS|nr:hypothetical protein PISL3812_01017 [Talaromyces islandicus]
MFENGFLGLFRSAKPQDEQPQPTWNASTMAMEQPASYTGEQHAPSPESEQMKLRGGAGCCDICCGCCAGLCAFECLEECC